MYSLICPTCPQLPHLGGARFLDCGVVGRAPRSEQAAFPVLGDGGNDSEGISADEAGAGQSAGAGGGGRCCSQMAMTSVPNRFTKTDGHPVSRLRLSRVSMAPVWLRSTILSSTGFRIIWFGPYKSFAAPKVSFAFNRTSPDSSARSCSSTLVFS